MPRALPLVATLVTLGTVWSAEPVRPLDWKPIKPVTTTPTPAPVVPSRMTSEATPATFAAPASTSSRTPTTELNSDGSRFTPFNGMMLQPMVISEVDGDTILGLQWDLDLSLIHNRLTSFIRGLPKSDGNRSIAKGSFDLDARVQMAGQSAAKPALNPGNHQDMGLVGTAGYGFVGAAGSANHFSDDASSLYFRADAGVGLEADQLLKTRQMITGVSITATPSLSADLADYNILDWIPRVGRFLSGDDWTDNGSGRALPTITVGVDNVSASDNDLRQAIAPNDTSYMRLHVAFAGKAPVWRLPGSDQYINGTISLDLYREMSAPTSVTNAGIDNIDHLTVGVDIPSGLSLNFNYGELPMDPVRRAYFTMGWKFTL